GIAPMRRVDGGDVHPVDAVGADLDLLAGRECAVGAGYRQRLIAGADDVVGRALRRCVVDDRGDRQRLGRRTGVNGDRLAGAGADIAGAVTTLLFTRSLHDALPIFGIAPMRRVDGGDVHPVDAVGADLDLLAGRECAVGAGYRQ